jgi:hypothetical protein
VAPKQEVKPVYKAVIRRAADLYPTKALKCGFSEILEKRRKAVAWVLIKAIT